MLVLSRKNREAVAVGGIDDLQRLVKVTVLEIHHGSAKLGFEVDDEVPIPRWEVWERIRAADHPGRFDDRSGGEACRSSLGPELGMFSLTESS